ncbi:hypothetical protein KO481_26555 [Nocardia sp. NEAU-G5]|uniref:Uncharacterized protein n=1 Tax=Nocardia albiluteola TaxID=2842303 RepID=A0ABS6B4A4_9NOCA|nr:hypothetical protein [Nocardia albiluteola]MBU3065079.1 hypothetical protein [Nocardia albiluteola]
MLARCPGGAAGALSLFHQATGDPNAPELSRTTGLSASGPWFGMPAARIGAPARTRYQEWPLRSRRPYLSVHGRGTARVYLADGHDAPVRPFLFADGFAYGPSDLDGLFDRLDAPYAAGSDRFLEQLLSSRVDVILIGFDTRHDYVQVNAGVVQECMRWAASRTGRSSSASPTGAVTARARIGSCPARSPSRSTIRTTRRARPPGSSPPKAS